MGGSIVSSRIEKLLPEDRYNYQTSTTAKVIRNLPPVKALLDFIGVELSPIDLDHWWKNTTGNLGIYAFDAIDTMLEGLDIDKKMNLRLTKPISH